MSAETLALRAEAVRAETMRKGQVQRLLHVAGVLISSHQPLLFLPHFQSTCFNLLALTPLAVPCFPSTFAVRYVLDVLDNPHGTGIISISSLHRDIQSITRNQPVYL